MTSSVKEGIYIRVLKDSTYRICNADPVGYYFDGGREPYTYPHKVLTHFMACYGPAHKADNTAECFREIESYKIMSAAEILGSGDQQMIDLFNEQLIVFPTDRDNPRMHVFRLGKKTMLPADRQKFTGANRGYFSLSEMKGE
jgi:hypothetical protein